MKPSTEERMWAVLSHLSSLALGMGILLPVIGWSEQRRKSKYASFQCLQALGYQSLGFTVWLLSFLIFIIGFLVILVVMSLQAENRGQVFVPFSGITTSWMYALLFAFLAIYLLLPAVAAIACALGKDFRYPILGNRLARYLDHSNPESAAWNEDRQEHWVAAMGHFSVLIILWGILAPLAAWVAEGKRSPFLRFQSMQTAVYQAFVNLLYLAAVFVSLAGVSFLFATTGLEGGAAPASPLDMAGLVIFGLASLGASAILLVVPLFHILGQWAGYRVLKGDNYHYPLLSRWVEKWIQRSEARELSSGTPKSLNGGT